MERRRMRRTEEVEIFTKPFLICFQKAKQPIKIIIAVELDLNLAFLSPALNHYFGTEMPGQVFFNV